jgi:GntR family transcriptional regulator/MocR family aminotransferase
MSIPIETFFLDPNFQGTLQQQIQRMVIEGILSRRFSPGDKLPSSRKLADHLGVSRITVTLAYGELQSDDYLVSRGRSGYFVSETAPMRTSFDLPALDRKDTVNWARAIDREFAGQVMPVKPENWQSYPYPFIYGQADNAIFDHANWRLCALQALGKRDFATVTADYFERDDAELIKYIALHTLPRRGILARPEEILITMGAQNALWLSAQVLLGRKRRAAMENPGYPGLRAVLNMTDCDVAYVGVDEDGMQIEDLPKGVDVVFTTPSHHCPTNVTMPVDRRQALLRMAESRDFLIVEDDYEFEMSFLKPPAPALKSLDGNGRVVYVGSFSKSLFPGLRLGYLVGSEPFIRQARALRAAMLRHPPGHIQRTVANFLSLGHYDALVGRMAQTFRKRREVMARALGDNGLSIEGQSGSGGSSFWMRAADDIDMQRVSEALSGLGVLVEPGHVFFDPAQRRDNYFRLAYSSIAAAKIPEGIRLIAAALKDAGHIVPEPLALSAGKP